MFEYITGHASYWFVIVLLCIGLYGMIFKRSLVKKVVGLTMLQSAIIIFWVSLASKPDATVPVKEEGVAVEQTANYLNPLPHTLMLTAIVVGVATLGVAFSLLIQIWNRYRTLDEKELIDKIQ